MIKIRKKRFDFYTEEREEDTRKFTKGDFFVSFFVKDTTPRA